VTPKPDRLLAANSGYLTVLGRASETGREPSSGGTLRRRGECPKIAPFIKRSWPIWRSTTRCSRLALHHLRTCRGSRRVQPSRRRLPPHRRRNKARLVRAGLRHGVQPGQPRSPDQGDAGRCTGGVEAFAAGQNVIALYSEKWRSQWRTLRISLYPQDRPRTGLLSSDRRRSAGCAACLRDVQNIAGLSIGEITRRLNAQGVRTRKQSSRCERSRTAPAFVALDNDGSWLSSPTQQNYRMQGDRYIVERVLDRAELVSGVGSGQTCVVITRDGA
jgi:hypothetical protein